MGIHVAFFLEKVLDSVPYQERVEDSLLRVPG